MVVLHYTAMECARAAEATLSNPKTEVSAHYLIDADGLVAQLVDETKRAWHAGAGSWGDVTDVNSHSIGIELSNTGFCPFPEPQMAALEQLLHGIRDRWRIPPERIIGHSDMAPGRKIDPGARFDWQRLARQDLVVWPKPASVDGGGQDQAFQDAARRFGYSADVAPETLLAAFRLRFRPWASGPLDQVDLGLIADLARRYPVDPQHKTT